MTETPFSELLIPATWEESRPKRKVSGPKPLIRYCSVTELATQFPKCHPRIGDLVTAAQDVQRCAQYLIFLSSGISALSAYLDWAVELGMLGDEAVEIIINKQGKDAQKKFADNIEANVLDATPSVCFKNISEGSSNEFFEQIVEKFELIVDLCRKSGYRVYDLMMEL